MLVEKPIAATAAEAEDLVALAESRGDTLGFDACEHEWRTLNEARQEMLDKATDAELCEAEVLRHETA